MPDFTIHYTKPSDPGKFFAQDYNATSAQDALDTFIRRCSPSGYVPVAWSLDDGRGTATRRKESINAGRTCRKDASHVWRVYGAPLQQVAGVTAPVAATREPDKPTASPNVLKGGKQRITLVHELPRNAQGFIVDPDDAMAAVRLAAGGKRRVEE